MLDIFQFSLRLFLALLLGAAIGVERQWRQRMAGLRTNTLVSLGASIFITLAVKIGGDATGRVASYVVSGIGFLGAGVIMKDGMNVKGLNTAATLWCSADNGDPSIALINAEIFATGNQDHKIERLAGRLTIEQGISEVSWKVIGEENDL
ncbi:MAG TPA: MgtC/SapB family protein [Puia sp.]